MRPNLKVLTQSFADWFLLSIQIMAAPRSYLISCLWTQFYNFWQAAKHRTGLAMAASWIYNAESAKRIQAAIEPLLALIISELNRGISRGDLRPDMNTPLIATMIMETVINSFRAAVYDKLNMSDLEPVLKDRLSVILRSMRTPDRV